MREEIVAKIHFSSTNLQIIVRRTVFREDGMVGKKYGLSTTGEWIEVPEATNYPDECHLPITPWNKLDSESVRKIVGSLRKEETLRDLSKELDNKEGVSVTKASCDL